MQQKLNLKSIILLLSMCFAATPVFANTMFSFDSADISWVGQGESVYVTPDDGYLFTSSGTQNYISLDIASLNSPFGPEWNPNSGDDYNYWTLDIAAPFNDLLEIGLYDNAARYPFQDDDQPGLTLSGNHRGNNRNSGFFEIYELSFDTDGSLACLGVDFTQYGEESQNRWITGSIHYNTSPVPEPTTILFLGIGLAGLFGNRIKRKKK